MLDQPVSGDAAIDIAAIVRKLWHRRLWIIAAIVVSFLISLVVVRLVGPAYTIDLKVTPVSSSDNISGKMGQFSGLAAAAGISLDKSSGASPFDLYLELLRSRELAGVLATDRRIMQTVFYREWNGTTAAWHEPTGVLISTKAGARALVGAPAQPWHAPDGTRLQQYLGQEVVVARGTKDPITHVIYEHQDPAFGKYLLERMNRIADEMVRKQSLDRSRAYAQYLAAKLPSVQVVEQRQALTSILSDQEKSIMMASTPLPFAALSIDTINTSDHPTKPNGFFIVAIAAVLGLVLGIVIALIDWPALRRRAPIGT